MRVLGMWKSGLCENEDEDEDEEEGGLGLEEG